MEQQLAQAIAEDRWRLNRIRVIESNLFAVRQQGQPAQPGGPDFDLCVGQAKTWLMDGKSLQLLTLYEQRIQRSIRHNTADLRAMQARRLAALQQTVEEELLLAQLAQSKGETYQIPEEVATPEFVFSRDEIEPLMARQKLLNEARALPNLRLTPKSASQTQTAA
jgi:hypothetical protein